MPTRQQWKRWTLPSKAGYLGLVAAVLVGIATLVVWTADWITRSARARFELARELEPWVNVAVLRVAKHANLRVTYGSQADIQSAVEMLGSVLDEAHSTRSTREPEIASFLGQSALDQYRGLLDGVERLRECYGILAFKVSPPFQDEGARAVLRPNCSRALRDIDARGTAFLGGIAEAFPDLYGRRNIASDPFTSLWLPISIRVNGQRRFARLGSAGSFLVSWWIPDATACLMQSPVSSGVSVAGISAPIDTLHPWFPHGADTTKILVHCTNGWMSVSDSVLVTR